MCPIRWPRLIRRRPDKLEVVLDQYAIQKHGHARWTVEGAVRLEVRPMEDDVIRLPLARRPGGVDERRVLAVDRTGLPVGIGVVLIGIEDLELVPPHQKDPAVATLLTFALHDRR